MFFAVTFFLSIRYHARKSDNLFGFLDMKYLILLGLLVSMTACSNFSISNPGGLGDYNYNPAGCCYSGNEPRP
jgi:hypothetical protein